MSKNIIFVFLVIMTLLFAGEAAGFQSRQKTPEHLKRQEEFQKKQTIAVYKAEIVDATPVQLGVLTEQQRKHSKLYVAYGRDFPKKISEFIPQGQSQVQRIGIGLGAGPKLTESVSPKDYFSGMVTASDAVILGRVIKKVSQITEDDTFIFTDYEVVIMEVFKNNTASLTDMGNTITVTRPGGKVLVGTAIMEATDELFLPLPESSREVILFLKYLPETGTYQTERYNGSFEFVGNLLHPLTEAKFPRGVIVDSLSLIQTIRTLTTCPTCYKDIK
jgi:hypothetical protein